MPTAHVKQLGFAGSFEMLAIQEAINDAKGLVLSSTKERRVDAKCPSVCGQSAWPRAKDDSTVRQVIELYHALSNVNGW